jgi:hypothetical protein
LQNEQVHYNYSVNTRHQVAGLQNEQAQYNYPFNTRHSHPDIGSPNSAYQQPQIDLAVLQKHTPNRTVAPHSESRTPLSRQQSYSDELFSPTLSRQSSGSGLLPEAPISLGTSKYAPATPKRSAAMFDAALLRDDGFVRLHDWEGGTPSKDPGGGTFSNFRLVAEVGRTNSAANDRDEMEARLAGLSFHDSPQKHSTAENCEPGVQGASSPEHDSNGWNGRGSAPPPLLHDPAPMMGRIDSVGLRFRAPFDPTGPQRARDPFALSNQQWQPSMRSYYPIQYQQAPAEMMRSSKPDHYHTVSVRPSYEVPNNTTDVYRTSRGLPSGPPLVSNGLLRNLPLSSSFSGGDNQRNGPEHHYIHHHQNAPAGEHLTNMRMHTSMDGGSSYHSQGIVGAHYTGGLDYMASHYTGGLDKFGETMRESKIISKEPTYRSLHTELTPTVELQVC